LRATALADFAWHYVKPPVRSNFDDGTAICSGIEQVAIPAHQNVGGLLANPPPQLNHNRLKETAARLRMGRALEIFRQLKK
ncbi:MAG TPA: hypothetical protein VGB09_01715, partial [Candidatus Binatia bacterium]